MKKRNILAVSALILVLLFLCSGCSAALQRFENTDVRQCAETMLNALIADDFDTAYSLVSAHGTEEDFKPIFAQMRELLSDTDTYELTLLSIHVNSTVSNGQKINSVSSVYEMTTQNGTMIVSIGVDDQIGITGFHLIPYEKNRLLLYRNTKQHEGRHRCTVVFPAVKCYCHWGNGVCTCRLLPA